MDSDKRLVRAAMIGDVVGEPGLKILETKLPLLISEKKVDFVTVNGENAADGFGLTEYDYRRIMAAGADVVTSGNHVWEKREFWSVLENEKTMLRPANYYNAGSQDTPGSGFVNIKKNGVNWLVINLQGREFMNSIDCPFICLDKILIEAGSADIILIDFHAESAKEKEALAYYADGRVSLIVGTHTHVQTADEHILPKGSAYITDIGMTGITDSVIGMDPVICRNRFIKQVQYQMKPAASDKPGEINGVIAEIDSGTGKAISVKRLRI